MRTQGLLCLAIFLGAAPCRAQDKKDTPATPGQEQYRAAYQEFLAARQEIVKEFQAATTVEDKEKIQAKLIGLLGKFDGRFFKIAEDHPKDPGAEDALALMTNQLGINELTEAQGAKAFALLVTNFPQSKKLPQALNLASFASSAALEKPLRQLMETHPDVELQSRACLVLAENLRVRHEKAVQKKDAVAAALHQQSEELLKAGQVKFGETKSAKDFSEALNALRRLTVGKTPPAIDGEDVVSGKVLKLSDFKGKVVVVCFWGNWCPPCRAMFPHERALVKRLEGKPFALLGVNSDKDRETTKEIMAKEQLTWPSFWNGGGTQGPISTEYQVRFWPTIYVLDAQGVIRFRNVRNHDMDVAVDTLLTELEGKK